MAKFPALSSKQPQSAEQEFATLMPSSKKATGTAQLFAGYEAH